MVSQRLPVQRLPVTVLFATGQPAQDALRLMASVWPRLLKMVLLLMVSANRALLRRSPSEAASQHGGRDQSGWCACRAAKAAACVRRCMPSFVSNDET